jgi:hypothetical protein
MKNLAMEILCTFLRLLSLLSPNIYISASQSEPTVTELRLDDRFLPGAEILSSSSQPDLMWCPLAIPPGIERPGRDADHSNTNGAELKTEWSYACIPAYDFMAYVKSRKEYKLHFPPLFSPK